MKKIFMLLFVIYALSCGYQPHALAVTNENNTQITADLSELDPKIQVLLLFSVYILFYKQEPTIRKCL